MYHRHLSKLSIDPSTTFELAALTCLQHFIELAFLPVDSSSYLLVCETAASRGIGKASQCSVTWFLIVDLSGSFAPASKGYGGRRENSSKIKGKDGLVRETLSGLDSTYVLWCDSVPVCVIVCLILCAVRTFVSDFVRFCVILYDRGQSASGCILIIKRIFQVPRWHQDGVVMYLNHSSQYKQRNKHLDGGVLGEIMCPKNRIMLIRRRCTMIFPRLLGRLLR